MEIDHLLLGNSFKVTLKELKKGQQKRQQKVFQMGDSNVFNNLSIFI